MYSPAQELPNRLKYYPTQEFSRNVPLQILAVGADSLSVSRLSMVGFSTLFFKLDLKTETILKLNMSCS